MAKETTKSSKNAPAKGETLNLGDFSKSIADDMEDMSAAKVKSVLDAYFGSVEKTILGDTLNPGDCITMPGFGRLVCVQKAARKVRNPATGESFVTPARPAIKFKMSARLRLWGKEVKKDDKPAKKAAKK